MDRSTTLTPVTGTQIKAVLFDFGGVVTTSPFEAFARYEEANGLPVGLIRQINSTNPDDNAWAKLERSEVDPAGFAPLFEAEAAALGHQVSGAGSPRSPQPATCGRRWSRPSAGSRPRR